VGVREARLVKKFWAYLKLGPHWRTEVWYSILGVYVASQLTHAIIPALYPYFHPDSSSRTVFVNNSIKSMNCRFPAEKSPLASKVGHSKLTTPTSDILYFTALNWKPAQISPRFSRNLTVLGLKEGNGHAMPRSAHNLSLVELRMPVPAILQPLIPLQQPNNCHPQNVSQPYTTDPTPRQTAGTHE